MGRGGDVYLPHEPGDHRVLSRAAKAGLHDRNRAAAGGAPYTLAKLRHRQALAAGIAACGAAVLIGSFFVWDIQIAGNETVPREVILRSLEKNGVHQGCFGFALNGGGHPQPCAAGDPGAELGGGERIRLPGQRGESGSGGRP